MASAAVVGTAGLSLFCPALRRRPLYVAVLSLNVALALLYFWSWDEAHLVVIHVTRTGAVATVDGDVAIMNQPVGPGRLGLQQAPYASYRIQATGEAGQSDRSSLVGRLAATVRLAQPAPGWSPATIEIPGGRARTLTNLTSLFPVASWSHNERGELTAPESSFGVFAPTLEPPYTVTLSALRPEGSANVLLDVGANGSGYALQIRYDQPDLLWSRWDNGVSGAIVGASQLHEMYFVNQLQRALRVSLPAFLFAILFASCAIGAYPVLMALFGGFNPQEGEDLTFVQRVLDAPMFSWAFPALVTGAALAATGTVSTDLLSRIPHVQDSVAYLFQGKIFADGMLSAPAPPPAIRAFFAEEYMPFHGSAWFSQYPPGHPIMLALGVLAGAPWLVGPLAASLSLAGTYLLGRIVFNSGTGALAALLGLSSPFWLFLGSSFMAHPTGLFFGTACIVCFALTEERGGTRWPLIGGFAGGMLFLTRQITAVGLLGPLVVYGLFFSRRTWRAYLPAVPTFLIPAMLLLAYNWALMGNPLQSTYGAWDPYYGLGFGAHRAPFGDFTVGDGAWNAYQNLSMLSAQLYGWPYGIGLSFMALPFITGAARRWDYVLLACFLGIVIVHTFYWCACLMYGPRFYYEALPAIFLLSARGMYELFRLPLRVWRGRGLPRDETLAAFMPALLLAALLLFNVRFYLPAQIGLYTNYNFSSAAELDTVKKAGIHHALVFVVSNPPGFWASYGNVFFENDPRLRGDIVYAHDLGASNRALYPYFPGRRHYRLNGTTLTPIS